MGQKLCTRQGHHNAPRNTFNRDLENSWSLQVQCEKICYLHGESNARGVLIAFQNDLHVAIKQKVCDENGRFIVLECIIQDSPFLVINLYNSNNKGEQVKQNSRDLIDIWLLRFPQARRYTFRQPNPFLQRRFDYFMISDFLQDHTKHVDITTPVNTHQSAIVLQLSKIEGPIRGPSYRKFNNSLLDYNNFIDGMRDERRRFLNSDYSHNDPGI